MTDQDPFADRKRLTFEQAEGVAPLPTQLKLKELSEELRARLWAAVYHSFKDHRNYGDGGYHFLDPWASILKGMHVYRYHLMADKFENDFDDRVEEAKVIFKN